MNEKTLQHNLMSMIRYKIIGGIVHKTLKQEIDSRRLKVFKRAMKREYKAMLRRTPAVEDSTMTGALLAGAVLFSAHKADTELVDEPMFEKMALNFANASFLKRIYTKKDAFSVKDHEIKSRQAVESQQMKSPMRWIFTHEVLEHEYYTTYTQCGLCELARKEGCFELVKYMCKMDYTNIDMMGGKLIRTKTIADGDEVCDFHVVPKA